MLASIPNYNAFYLIDFLERSGYSDALTKLFTEWDSVSIKLIKAIKI